MLLLLLEALVVGVSTVVVGALITLVVRMILSKIFLKEKKAILNNFGEILLILFFTGFFLHFIFEAVGANRWYVNYKKSKE